MNLRHKETAQQIFLWYSVRRCKSAITTTATTRDDFQTLIVLVAVFFCFSQLFPAVCFCLKSLDVDTAEKIILWSESATILNSSINLFIYTVVSLSFRRAFQRLLKRIFCDRERELINSITIELT